MITFYVLLRKYYNKESADETSTLKLIEEEKVDMDKIGLVNDFVGYIAPDQSQTTVVNVSKEADREPLSYMENLKALYDVYAGTFICFFSTLWIYPVLIFNLDIHVSDKYKFLVLTFVFNMGDVIGRYIYEYSQLMSKRIMHVLCAIKLVSIPVFYCTNYVQDFYKEPWFILLCVFLFSTIHGFVCTGYYNIGSNEFQGKVDRYRSGNFTCMFLIIGLSVGGLSSYVWPV